MRRLGDIAKKLSPADIRALFPDAWWHEVFQFQNDQVPVHFVDSSVAIDGNLVAGDGPWNLVVHGDLHATGDLDFATGDYKTSLLVMLGSVRARNFQFTNGATCSMDNRDVFAPEILDEDGRIELRDAWEAATNEAAVLLPDAEARLRRR